MSISISVDIRIQLVIHVVVLAPELLLVVCRSSLHLFRCLPYVIIGIGIIAQQNTAWHVSLAFFNYSRTEWHVIYL